MVNTLFFDDLFTNMIIYATIFVNKSSINAQLYAQLNVQLYINLIYRIYIYIYKLFNIKLIKLIYE